MDSITLFHRSVHQASHCIAYVQDDQLRQKTPCSAWNLRQLLNHMVGELLWVPELLSGKTITDVGDKYSGDVLGKEVASSWQRAAELADAAVQNQDDLQAPVHLSYADVTADHYIKEIAGDILIHTWDVAQSIKCSLIIPEDLANVVYQNILPRQQEFADSGLFGTPVSVAKDASNQTKLLALVGRKVDA